MFEAPTQRYKAGLAFLSWLSGLQPNPLLANHLQRARDRAHYERLVTLAGTAGVLTDTTAARARWHAALEREPRGWFDARG